MTKTWTTQPSGHDKLTLDGYTLIVWTGSSAADLDDGHQVMSCYIPTTDRAYPDGLLIVGRRRLDTRDRAEAREIALQIALDAIADFQSDRLRRAA